MGGDLVGDGGREWVAWKDTRYVFLQIEQTWFPQELREPSLPFFFPLPLYGLHSGVWLSCPLNMTSDALLTSRMELHYTLVHTVGWCCTILHRFGYLSPIKLIFATSTWTSGSSSLYLWLLTPATATFPSVPHLPNWLSMKEVRTSRLRFHYVLSCTFLVPTPSAVAKWPIMSGAWVNRGMIFTGKSYYVLHF